MSQERKPNRLASEKSPYLLQHSENPVNWFPWGEEAWNKAKDGSKPILLSIGYSTCHWCHVMAHESFEDMKVADFVNKNFVAIKVDREERPEVDSYYMSAVQGMTGQGGWPLTVFLTPELKAFYGGTYYPPEPKYGMPSFTQVLEFVAKLWKESRGDVRNEAERIAKALQEQTKVAGTGELSLKLLDDAFSSLAASSDPEHGGFGGAPKFPLPLSLDFMLLYHYRTGKELALRTATKSLEAMAAGGIYDHVGGGFHRYSTDRIWLVPHFEKMLYDNALLAATYIHAFKITSEARFADAARGTLGWMVAELQSSEGGFYSAQDADTEEGEGVYYTWTPKEIGSILEKRDADIVGRFFGVTENGNLEGGRTILRRVDSIDDAATKFGLTAVETAKTIKESLEKMYRARKSRPRPSTDTKVLTSWNGLAISALAQASWAFGDSALGEASRRAAEFVLTKNLKDGELMRRYAGGEASIPATLEDFSFLGIGLLDLAEASSEPRWLDEAVKLAEKMCGSLEDKKEGGFFGSTSQVPARLVETYDGPTPSGNSAAILLLLRLSSITGKSEFTKAAERALQRFQPALDKEPNSHTLMLTALDFNLNGRREVVVSAKTKEGAERFVQVLRSRYLPDTTSLIVTDQNLSHLSKLSPLVEGREPRAEPIAYVCQNFACKLPARTPEDLRTQLDPVRR